VLGIPALPLYILPASFSKAAGTAKTATFLVMTASLIVVVTVVLRLLFASSVVVLEGVWALKALKRSKALATGFNWRNLAVLSLLFVVVLIVLTVAATAFTLLHVKSAFVARIFTTVVATINVPLFFIAVVLLYYDIRVRKEAYDNSALAEDLRR
jgi:hypothetical protein